MDRHPRPKAPHTLARALADPRFLLSVWMWRSLAYVATTFMVGGVLATVAAPLYMPWVMLMAAWETGSPGPETIALAVFLGVSMVLVVGPLIALPLGALERHRLRLVLPDPHTSSGHRAPPAGLWGWIRVRYTEAATWREVAYVAVMLPMSGLIGLLCMILFGSLVILATGPFILSGTAEDPINLGPIILTTPQQALPYTLLAPVFLVLLLYTCGLYSYGHGVIARALLVGPPKEELRAELDQVTESRARLAGAFEYERRRIERDLHDGAQQRLVALSMDLGMARVELEEGSAAERRVAAAQAKADDLIDELRELVRGIHPRVLTDRGLPEALAELADHSPVPVSLDVDLPGRCPSHVEGTAYFVVVEALTNVHKHTEAEAVTVCADLREEPQGDVLVVEVGDHGPGGAEPARGSGLTGMADRVAVMGGTMDLSSPVGGPTRIRVELPCTISQTEVRR